MSAAAADSAEVHATTESTPETTERTLPERKNPRQGFCSYYFEKKGRFCGMQVRKNVTPEGTVYNKYCAHHDPNNGRIVCPLDDSHTVLKTDLEAHLKRCPGLKKKKKFEEQPFIKKGANGGSADEIKQFLPEHPIDSKPPLIDRVKAAGERFKSLFDLQVEQLQSEAVENYMKTGSIKHTPQLSSIVAHISRSCLPTDSNEVPCIVEFGAGKAKLSQALAVHLNGKGHFVLLDRAHFHHKSDKALREALHIEGVKEEVKDASLERVSADIIDFVMAGSKKVEESNVVCGIGKHVCGAAADMTIRCIETYFNKRATEKPHDKFYASLCLALCCYHASSWPCYVGKEFLYNAVGVEDEEEFKALIKMPSWYTCYLDGFVNKKKKTTNESEEGNAPKKPKLEPGDRKRSVIENSETKFVSDAAKDPRAPIGLIVHRLLSTGRLEYLKKHGYAAKLVLYTSVSYSLENTLLVASKINE